MRRPRRIDDVLVVLDVRHLPAASASAAVGIAVVIVAVVVVVLILRVELVVPRLLRPHDALQALLEQGVDDATVIAKIARDLILHPHDQARVHPNVVVFGASDLVGELELRGGALDVSRGEGDADAAAADAAAAAAAGGGDPPGRRGGGRRAAVRRRRRGEDLTAFLVLDHRGHHRVSGRVGEGMNLEFYDNIMIDCEPP